MKVWTWKKTYQRFCYFCYQQPPLWASG